MNRCISKTEGWTVGLIFRFLSADNSNKSLKEDQEDIEKDAKEEAKEKPKRQGDKAKVNGDATPTGEKSLGK